MTRIRYTKNGSLLTSSEILIGAEAYKATINTENNTYVISNGNDKSYTGGEATLQKAKASVKNTFKNLGIVFTAETRKTKKDAVENTEVVVSDVEEFIGNVA